MEQEDFDFIVNDGYDHNVDPLYEPNGEDSDSDSVSDEDEDEDEDEDLVEVEDEDTVLDKNSDEDGDVNDYVNEDLDCVTVNLPLPLKFDEAWFEKFQIINLIKSGLKK